MLFCGIFASTLFVVSDVLGGVFWEGYTFTVQSISELSAIGAPTRPLIVPLNLLLNVLLILFGLGARACWRRR
jgi:hypothetical protein